MRPIEILHQLADHLNVLLARAARMDPTWSTARRNFARRLLVGLVMAGDVMLSQIVRHFPGAVGIRHRYKNADRMLGLVDLVPVARQQAYVLGELVGPGHVIAIDLSDIRKLYAEKMERLSLVYDGSTGDIAVPGYGLVTATAFDTAAGCKTMPIPLVFETYSSADIDFKSETAIWLDTIDVVAKATPAGVLAIDRAGDNGRILRRLVAHRRDWVVRIKAGRSCRMLEVFGRRMLVSTALEHTVDRGSIEATRESHDDRRSTYQAKVSSLPVRVPTIDADMWLCVFDSPHHKQPLVVLTSLRADTVERLSFILACYFGRWASEEMHRFAKQSFKLENVRTLTWRRTKNLVAMVAIAMGALARVARLPTATTVLRSLEAASQRIIEPLGPGQFWGYALASGMAAILIRNARMLPLVAWLLPTRRPPDPQLALL